MLKFLSTLSLRRATNSAYGALDGASISIHALLAESDNNINSSVNTADKISIHALLAESDVEEVSGDTWERDFYPRSPCGERHDVLGLCEALTIISIHALLAESD